MIQDFTKNLSGYVESLPEYIEPWSVWYLEVWHCCTQLKRLRQNRVQSDELFGKGNTGENIYLTKTLYICHEDCYVIKIQLFF